MYATSCSDVSEYAFRYPPPPKPPLGKQLNDKNIGDYLSGLSITTLSAERLNLFLHAADEAPEDSAVGELIPNNVGTHGGDEERANYNGRRRRSTFHEHEPRWKQKLKLALPHIGLVLLSMTYTIIGALIFYAIEAPHEHKLKKLSLEKIRLFQREFSRDLMLANAADNVTLDADRMQEHIEQRLDKFMETLHQAFTHNYVTLADIRKNGSDSMWSFTSSLFFSATVITAIGYGHLVPQTTEGRVACLVFCLIGIPLILVTIADMGRFLSVYVIKVYGLYSNGLHLLSKCISSCCRRLTCHKNTPQPTVQGSTAEGSQAGGRAGGSQATSDAAAEVPHEKDRSVSIMFILLLLVGYTAFGGAILRLWEPWSFFESFYYCFITVTTIGFGDFIPQNQRFIPATLLYIIVGLIITTMCIDLVGSQYIREIHYFGRNVKNITQQALITIGGRVINLSDIFGYVAYLQRSFGLTTEQLEKMARLPDDYLLDCLIHGRQPNLNYMGARPYIPSDIYSIKWIEQPRTLSYTSEKVLASIESLDVTSRCSTARTPREWYYHMIMEHMKDTKI